MRQDLFIASPNDPRGIPLRKVNNSTLNRVTEPDTIIIPPGGYTELVWAGDCLELMFTIISLVSAGTSPGSPVAIIERSRSQNCTLSADINTYANISPASNWSMLSWNAGQALFGWFRVKNNHGTDSIQVNYMKRFR